MPPVQSVKTALLEVTLFITLLALVGHVSVNFWERYVIQTELSRLKHSLHSLRNTINYIGNAYVHLYSEIRCLADEVSPGDPEHDKENLAHHHNTRTAKSKNMSHPHKVEKKLPKNQGVQVAAITNDFSIGTHPETNNSTVDTPSSTKVTLIQQVLNGSTSYQLSNIADLLSTNEKNLIKNVHKTTQYDIAPEHKDADSQVFRLKDSKAFPKTVSKMGNKKKRGLSSNSNIYKYCNSDPNDFEHYCYSKF